MTNIRPKIILLNAVGLAFCILPVTISIMLYFPIWRDRGAATLLSGFSLMLLLMAIVPLIKFVGRIFKSPSAYLMWFFAFVIFFMLSEIAQDMTVICFVGFISNLVGAVFFKLAERCRNKKVT